MKIKKTLSAILIATVMLITGCETTKTPEPTDKTKSQMLVDANWKLSSATFNPAIIIEIGSIRDTFLELFDIPLIEDCQKDNMILFNADGTMTIDNGTLKCSGSEPQTAKDGNWVFTNNENTIEITNSEYFKLISSSKVELNNITVSETELKGQTDYVFNDPLKGPVNTVISFTFTKQ